MIDSQPSASKPQQARPKARRPTVQLEKSVSRQDLGRNARWKVQLELAPAEIALVYRQGLAHGAEVRRHGTQEWRPLVTTPELRAALQNRASQPDLEFSSRQTPALTLTQTLAIGDPSLAALLLAHRPPATLSLVAPPPPPPITASRIIGVATRPGSIPDSAVTQPLPLRGPIEAEPELPVVSFTPVVSHARPVELSLAALSAVVVTLLGMVLAQRASHWGEARAVIPEGRPAVVARPSSASARPLLASSNAISGNMIPVVPVRDLPFERFSSAALASASISHPAAGSVDRADLTRVLARAAHSAKSCGSGPVSTQIVATFAPSGVPRGVHFGSAAPPPGLRSCVLNAVARARVKPFVGEPVTISKSLRW